MGFLKKDYDTSRLRDNRESPNLVSINYCCPGRGAALTKISFKLKGVYCHGKHSDYSVYFFAIFPDFAVHINDRQAGLSVVVA